MVKTPKLLKQQEQALLQKYNFLREIKYEKLTSVYPSHKLNELADFIDLCWRAGYKDQFRFDYTPDYLKWLFVPGEPGLDHSRVALSGDTIAAVFFSVPRTVFFQGRSFKTVLLTGLSVHPEFQAKGVSQHISLNIQEQAMETSGGLFCWFHSSPENISPSQRIHTECEKEFFDLWGRYHLKVLECNNGQEEIDRNNIDKGHTLPPEFEVIGENNYNEVSLFLNEEAKKGTGGRMFSPEEFKQYACYKGEYSNFSSYGILFRKEKEIAGVIVGYTIDILGEDRNTIFFLDYLYFNNEIEADSPGSFTSFVNDSAGIIKKRFTVTGILTIDQRPGKKEGFTPTGGIITCNSVPFCDEFIKKERLKRKSPVLDYK
ncbi:MAG: hypothetical protein GY754_17995 [bacterium]|nr:hypothetical protein [bacterium]